MKEHLGLISSIIFSTGFMSVFQITNIFSIQVPKILLLLEFFEISEMREKFVFFKTIFIIKIP